MKTLYFLLVLIASSFIYNLKAQNITVDATFNTTDTGGGLGDGANAEVVSLAVQPDGKILISGYFTTYNGTAINRIARLNSDGTLDESFNTGGSGLDGVANKMEVLSDGKIMIAGYFSIYNGVAAGSIVRLNSDGSIDNTFSTTTGANGPIRDMTIQSDGKIIIGGEFTSYKGTSRNRIARVNTNGTIDATFNPGTGANDFVNAVALQTDGKIVIGGYFTNMSGTALNYIARLNSDGTLDATFTPGAGANQFIQTIALQDDGKIVIGGFFSSYNGSSTSKVARLNADGTGDGTFTGNTGNNVVYSVKIAADGKIMIAGDFALYAGTSRNGIARLNDTGALDTAFDPGSGATGSILDLYLYSDGSILAVGSFGKFNDTLTNRVAKANSDGSVNGSFNPGQSGVSAIVRAIAMQTDGKILLGGDFAGFNGEIISHLIRLNSDGTKDVTFNASGSGPNSPVFDIKVLDDGKILIAGYFSAYNGTTISSLARLNSDGTLDGTFTSGGTGTIRSIVIQDDGKILIGGFFTHYAGVSRSSIARANDDGSLDTSFDPGSGVTSSYDIALQSDNKIILVGGFITYNGTTRRRIARLETNGTLDTSFDPGTGANSTIYAVKIQDDGKILVGGIFGSYNGTSRPRIARINSDGTLDTSFTPGTGAGAVSTNSVEAIEVLTGGNILIGGTFASFNGTSRNNIVALSTSGIVDSDFNPGSGASSTVYDIQELSDGKIMIGGDFCKFNGIGKVRIARIYQLQDQTISNFPAFPSKTYGDAGFTVNATASSGLTVTYTSSNTSVATVSANNITITGAGETTITATQTGNTVYAPTSAEQLLTISKKALTVSGVVAADKTYDGMLAATPSGGTLSGIVSADVVNLVLGTGAFGDKNVGTGKTVSFSGFTLGGTHAENYSLSSQPSSATASITAKTLSITGVTALNKTYDRTTTATPSGGALSGIVSPDVVTLVQGTASFADKNAGSGKTVTFAGFSITGAGAVNYSVTQPSSATASITTKTLSITGVTALNKTYDQTTTATPSGGTLNGVIAPDVVTLVPGTGTFPNANAGNGKTVTFSGFTVTGADAGNYSVTQPTFASAAINKKLLTITGVSSSNKVYDGTTAASATTGTLSGVISPDVVTLVQGTGNFTNKNVGTGKTVTFTGFSLTGTNSGNYFILQPTSVTASITAKTLSVAGVTASNKTYDGTTSATPSGGTLSGVISPDVVTLAAGTGSFGDKNVGTGKTVTFTGFGLTGTDGGNYSLSVQPSSGTASITAKPITLTAQSSQSKIYGSADPTLTYTSTPVLIAGDSFTGALQRTIGENAGAYQISQGTVSAGSNYAITFAVSNFTITPKSLTVTGTTASGKQYDGTVSATVSGGALNGVEAGDIVTLVPGTAVFNDVNVGANKIVTLSGYSLSGAQAGNYSLIQPSTTTASITARAATVNVAAGLSKIYGESDPVISYSVSPALLAGDSFAGALSRASGEDVGNYTITQGSLSAGGNYQITFNPAEFAIAKRTIGMTDITKQYDGATTIDLSGSSLTNVFPGDDISVASGSGTFQDKSVGVNKAITVMVYSLGGADAANYSIANSSPVGTITPKPLGLSGTLVANKTYDGTTSAQFTGGTLTGVITGDQVLLSGNASFADKNSGVNKTVTFSTLSLTGSDASNYSVSTPASATATITPKPISVNVNSNPGKVFGAVDPVFTYTVSPGLLSGDTFSGSLIRTSGESAGTYPITLGSLTAGNNYSITFTGSEFIISKASQSLTFALNFSEKETTDADFTITATASSGLPVVFTVLSGPGQINGSTVHLTGTTGTVIVVASQPGNENFNPATPAQQSFTVKNNIVGIEQHSLSTVEIYPNPATEFVNINAPGLIKLRVYEVCGKLLTEEIAQDKRYHRLDVRDYPAGKILMLMVETEHGVIPTKVIIDK